MMFADNGIVRITNELEKSRAATLIKWIPPSIVRLHPGIPIKSRRSALCEADLAGDASSDASGGERKFITPGNELGTPSTVFSIV
jgi:hypothetical protein